MNDPFRTHLLCLGASYAEATKVSTSAVGRDVLKDSTFFSRLEKVGAAYTNRTYLRLLAWFSLNWPANAGWPIEERRLGRAEAIDVIAATEPRKKPRIVGEAA